MLPSEKLAIAAHMHVLLRRKTGRVTDTQWMADNLDYAREIVRFARRAASEDGHTELIDWADKLESAMVPGMAQRAKDVARVPAAPTLGALLTSTGASLGAGTLVADRSRYVRGLR